MSRGSEATDRAAVVYLKIFIHRMILTRHSDTRDSIFFQLVGGFAEQEALVQLDRYMPKVAGFAQMVPDQDEIRKANVQKQLKNMNKSERGNLRYERMLRDSRLEDLSDIAKLGFIYKSGRDINGRTIIVIVARHLPAKAIDMNRVLLYIIRVMDSIVEREYSIVYVHSTMQSQNQPELSWMQEVMLRGAKRRIDELRRRVYGVLVLFANSSLTRTVACCQLQHEFLTL